MKVEERLQFYFLEADRHIEKIKRANKILSALYPFDADKLEELSEVQKDKLDVFIFRFSKLQDLLGEKIFRNYFEFSGRDSAIPFVNLLSELEKEGIIEVQKWRELRLLRNAIAHEYPNCEDDLIEAINDILKNVGYLVTIKENLERIVNENR